MERTVSLESSVLSPVFIVFRLLDGGHSDQCEVIPHCGFDLHFSNNNSNDEHLNVFFAKMSKLLLIFDWVA